MPIYKDGNSYSDRGPGADISDQLRRLLPQKNGKGRLPPAKPRNALPESRGEALPIKRSQSIASPLTEAADVRVYAAPVTLTTADGLFVVELEPVYSTQFIDANGEAVVVVYDEVPVA